MVKPLVFRQYTSQVDMWRPILFALCVTVVAAGGNRDFPKDFKFGAASAAYQVEGAWNHAIVAAGGNRDFPKDFKFGAASAAYQVEGAWNHANKGESIWDRFTHTRPEMMADAATGDVACDSFHLVQTDIGMCAELGLHFYRFSISWPRLLPVGFAHKVSEEGTRYYNELIDGLLAQGVEPMVTLYHWDLPQRLQDLGGWTNPEVADWFADYARVAFELFGDRVKIWITINEAIVVSDLAYIGGGLAPGVKDPLVAPHLAARHILLAHAKAYRVYDEEFRHKYHGKVSLANHAVWMEPASDSPEDVEMAELAMQLQLGRFSEPIFGSGGWPESVEKLVRENSKQGGFPRTRMPAFTKAEKKLLKGTADFFGLNHYTSRRVRASNKKTQTSGSWAWPLGEWEELPAAFEVLPEWPAAGNSWLKVYPDGLRKLLSWIKKNYGDIPIMITENGYTTKESGLEDDKRIQYYESYLDAVLKAIKEDKVNVTAYTAWTLLDNFEWVDGYTQKFGLYEVDFEDPARPRKARRSAHYYKNVIKHHSLDIPKDYLKDEL